MAEFDGLDGRLRDALGRAAVPGDSTGVADAIRSRVSSGDPGFPVAGPTAPGWAGRTLRWLIGGLLVGLLVVGGASGIAIGLAGVPGDEPATATPSPSQSVPSPLPEPSESPTATPTPSPTPTVPPAPAPAPPPPPPPPADTSPPTVQASSSGQVWIANNGGTTITAVVADDRGVAAVDVSWSGAATGSAPMTFSGGQWTYDYAPQPGLSPGSLTFVVTAVDAAGNAGSGSVTVPVGM